jgi:hypothetical protein
MQIPTSHIERDKRKFLEKGMAELPTKKKKKNNQPTNQSVLICVISKGIGINEKSVTIQPHTSPTIAVMGPGSL